MDSFYLKNMNKSRIPEVVNSYFLEYLDKEAMKYMHHKLPGTKLYKLDENGDEVWKEELYLDMYLEQLEKIEAETLGTSFNLCELLSTVGYDGNIIEVGVNIDVHEQEGDSVEDYTFTHCVEYFPISIMEVCLSEKDLVNRLIADKLFKDAPKDLEYLTFNYNGDITCWGDVDKENFVKVNSSMKFFRNATYLCGTTKYSLDDFEILIPTIT